MVTDGVLDALPGDDKEQAMGQLLDGLEEMPLRMRQSGCWILHFPLCRGQRMT